MARYVVRRLLQMVLVLFGASLVLFVCLYVVPGDPIATQQGEGHKVDQSTRRALERRYHLDQPVPQQYLHYVGRLARGDMGESYAFRRPVNAILGEKLGNTARLGLAAIALQIGIGVVAGIVAAISRYSFLDVLVTLSTTMAIGIPVFVIGLALQQAFAINLHLLPLQGTRGGAKSIILPALTLASVDTALVARLMRGTMLEVLRADYIRTATAKGLSKRVVIFKHALRNSIIPVLTYLGITFGTMLGGALITETIFNWDGVGLALVNAIQSQDNPIVLGVVTYGVGVFVLVNLLVDVSYAVLDPRIRLD
ncbi:MAG: oligopeptide transport system permease protein [Actinomycetota bacterium]|jgi:oligopeptide transport system permease protein|nr:oligopeptide transport system permease protein [Actinomycetota bacterium]